MSRQSQAGRKDRAREIERAIGAITITSAPRNERNCQWGEFASAAFIAQNQETEASKSYALRRLPRRKTGTGPRIPSL
jgi:hypothetical protein